MAAVNSSTYASLGFMGLSLHKKNSRCQHYLLCHAVVPELSKPIACNEIVILEHHSGAIMHKSGLVEGLCIEIMTRDCNSEIS
jgi:hypothetical protein